jgi:hypothetical protein
MIKIKDFTIDYISSVLVVMAKKMGYKNDQPEMAYSYWYKGDDNNLSDLFTIQTLISNDVALLVFLLRVIKKIADNNAVRLDIVPDGYIVSIGGNNVINHSKTLYEALFLSINDYIIKSNEKK